MKTRFVIIFFPVLFLSFSVAFTQEIPVSPSPEGRTEVTFFSIQQAFHDYWEPYNVSDDGYYMDNGLRVKAGGWKQFRRWEYFWEPRVDPHTGRFPSIHASDIYTRRSTSSAGRSATGNWTCMGPSTTPGGYAGLGRLNCVAFRSGDNNTIYTGAPSGGLWKTTDGGVNWMPLTDQNAVLGVSDAIVLAGPSTAGDTVYIGTGDRDGGSMWSLGGGQSNDNNSIGVLKSIDGGATWSTTGLTFTASQKRTVNRLLAHPGNHGKLYAATSAGLYQTADAGVNWSLLTTTEFVDIKFKPGDPQTIYGSARNGKIYLSTDGGLNWTNVADYYSVGGRRIDLAVSADEPAWVYAIVVASSNGLHGIYKSTNSGASYSVTYNGPNLLAWSCSGGDSGGQGYYDLAIAADPNNASTVFIGGVNTWMSTDGGATWSISNHWTGGCSVDAVHADQHYLAYQNGTSILFECNDGGLYKTSDNGVSWDHLGNGLVTSQMYRIGVAQTVSNDVIAGLQDNGTKAMLGGSWDDVLGGDGMDCAIDYTDENVQYGELYYGDLKRTTNHWSSYTSISSGLSGNAWWVMPFVIDPNVSTTLYAGLQEVYKSTDRGDSWSQISSMGNSTSLRTIAVAPSNSDYIYTATPNTLYRTPDGGASWSNITGTLPTGSSSITFIAVKEDDPNTAWVSMGQYNSYGVYQTTDGGAGWTNISAGLPSIPVMCVVQNKLNTAEAELYAGTDAGVYVKVGSTNWVLFSDGLPNVVVNELEIYYNATIPSLSRIRAGTSGRGLWESDLYSPPNTPPEANFMADQTYACVGHVVTFTDLSSNLPTSWTWSLSPSTVTFVGGTNANSQNPQVTFDACGNYNVQLVVSNAHGSDTEDKHDFIIASDLLTYCAAEGGGDEHISSVLMGTIDNSGTGADGYSDYRTLSTSITVNQTYDITLTYGTAYGTDDIGIWVDWNQDGDFDDAGENVVCQVGLSYMSETYSFTVPTDVSLGPTTMRIRMKYADVDCGAPCGTTSYGEVEDYQVVVLPGNNTWLGNNSNWHDINNWSDACIPTTSYNVEIPAAPAGGNFPVIQIGQTGTCNELTLQSGANVIITGTLNVINN